MNKQQLIDKAIDDLKGELPWGTNEACVLVYYPRPSSYAMSHPICIHSGAFEICTRREFEERKAERSQEQHWYDYENQKALRLPPVGEVCIVAGAPDDVVSKIIGTNHSGYRVYQSVTTGFCEMACQLSSFKPLDWNKRRTAAVNELTDLIKAEGVEGITAVSCADSILAAGYRKCDN